MVVKDAQNDPFWIRLASEEPEHRVIRVDYAPDGSPFYLVHSSWVQSEDQLAKLADNGVIFYERWDSQQMLLAFYQDSVWYYRKGTGLIYNILESGEDVEPEYVFTLPGFSKWEMQ